MDIGFRFWVTWHDEDVLQVRISGSNGEFAGTTDAYVAIGGLAAAADKLSGFPTTVTDARNVQFGNFGNEWAGGAVALSFKCMDSTGNVEVDARFESDCQTQGDQEAVLKVRVEPASIDEFVKELRALEATREGVARLPVCK